MSFILFCRYHQSWAAQGERGTALELCLLRTRHLKETLRTFPLFSHSRLVFWLYESLFSPASILTHLKSETSLEHSPVNKRASRFISQRIFRSTGLRQHQKMTHLSTLNQEHQTLWFWCFESWFSLNNTKHKLPHCLRETKEVLLNNYTHVNSSYLYFYRPGEIADVNEESDVWIVAEIKFLIGETVLVLFYIGFWNNWNFLPSLRASCFQMLKSSKKKDVSTHILSGKQKGRSILNFNVTKLTIHLNATILSCVALSKSLYAKILHY